MNKEKQNHTISTEFLKVPNIFITIKYKNNYNKLIKSIKKFIILFNNHE